MPEVCACHLELAKNLEGIDHTAPVPLAVSKDRLIQIKLASTDVPTLQVLRETIQQGWPESKTEVPPAVRAYFDFQDELTIQD